MSWWMQVRRSLHSWRAFACGHAARHGYWGGHGTHQGGNLTCSWKPSGFHGFYVYCSRNNLTKHWTPNFRDHSQMSNMLKHIMGRLWAPMEVQRLGLRFVEDFQVTGLTGEGVTWNGTRFTCRGKGCTKLMIGGVAWWYWMGRHTHTGHTVDPAFLTWHWNIFPPVDSHWSWDTPSPAMLFDGVKSTRSQCVVPKWSGSMRRCCAKHRRVGVALECFISPGKFDEIRMWSTLLWHICWLSIESRYSWTCNCRHVLISILYSDIQNKCGQNSWRIFCYVVWTLLWH